MNNNVSHLIIATFLEYSTVVIVLLLINVVAWIIVGMTTKTRTRKF